VSGNAAKSRMVLEKIPSFQLLPLRLQLLPQQMSGEWC
jgi:hypothetical protein